MSWQINRERLVVLGWGRAILLQLAHPLVAAGVAEHSGYRCHPAEYLERVRGTVGGMLGLTFGSDAEIARTAARIRGIHDRVHGTLPAAAGRFPAGTAYSAHDPALLAWVHATLIDTMLVSYELLVGPLTPGARDRYCAEARGIGPLLGVPASRLPADEADLRAAMTSAAERGDLVVTPAARELAHALLFPSWRALPEPARTFGRWMTVGLLPPAIREAYGLPWGSRQERRFRASVRIVRGLRACLPSRVRDWPDARVG